MNFSMNKPAFGSNNPFSTSSASATVGQNKPFGFSGAAPTSFGMASTGNMFGSTATGVQGTNAFQTTNAFAPSNPFGGGASMGTSTGAFGATSTTGPTNPFGALSSPSAQNTLGAFGGSNPSGGAFGSSLSATPNMGFNQSPSGLFGGNKSSVFPTSSTITSNLSGLGGATGAAPWGTSTGSGSPFGVAKPNPAPFGGSNPFGASTASNTLSGFTGGGSTPGLLGSSTSGFGGAFSTQQQQPMSSGLGGFGTAAAASPFGQQQQVSTTPFGMGTGALGSTGGFMSTGSMLGGAGGTGNPPFQPFEVKDTVSNGRGGTQQTTLKLQNICGMTQYNTKSLEELRLEDYSRNNKGPSKAATGLGGMLGGSALGGNMFGAKPAVGGFGGSNVFGASTTTSATTPSSGMFGAPQQQLGGAFGGQQAASSPFGQSNAFSGAATGSGGFSFGAAPAQNMFGAAPASNQQQPSGLFSTATQQQQPSSGMFSPTTTQQQQAPALFPTTNAPQTTGGFNFGATGSTSGFGSFSALSPQQSGSAFGTATAPSSTGSNLFNFGSTNTGAGASNLFSANKAAPAASNAFSSFSSFAKPAATAQPLSFTSSFPSFSAGSTGGFNQQVPGGASSFMPQQQQQLFSPQLQQSQPLMMMQQNQQLDVAGRIDLLKKKEEEIRNALKEQSKAVTPSTATEPPKQVPNLFSGFIGGKTSHHKPLSHYSSTSIGSRSTARLLPRGMRATDMLSVAETPPIGAAVSPRPITASGREGDMMFSPPPTASVGRNTKRLIISAISSPIPDPTEDLPRAPPSTNGKSMSLQQSRGQQGQQTPSSLNNSAMHLSESSIAEGKASIAPSLDLPAMRATKSGDATGLTPAAIGTPFHVEGRKSMSGTAGLSEPLDTSPITFHLTGRSTDDSFRRLSPDKTVQHFGQQIDDRKSSVAPILKRTDYCCSPDISVLQKLPPEDLARINQFTVMRPSYGKIVWVGDTDVRGLDLDVIVTIGRSEVSLYENSTPPSVGSELNKRAIVSLYSVFPKEGSTDRKKQEFDRKLRDYCHSSGAEFISYDRNSGCWEFEVNHFSRYGFIDSDDDEDDNLSAPAEERKGSSAPTRSSSLLDGSTVTAHQAVSVPDNRETTTMTVSENIKRLRHLLVGSGEAPASMDRDAAEAEVVRTRSAGDLPPSHRRRFAAGGGELPQQIIALKKPLPCSVLSMDVVRRMQISMRGATPSMVQSTYRGRLKDDAFQSVHQSPSMMLMMKVKKSAAQATGVAVDGSNDFTRATLGGTGDLRAVSSLQRGMQHYPLSMGRSFRVGWSSDGRIVHPGRCVFHSATTKNRKSFVISVERVDPLRWLKSHYELSCSSTDLYEETLSAILKGSHQRVPSSSAAIDEAIRSSVAPELHNLPLWSAPSANPLELHEYIPFLVMLKGVIGSFQSRQLKPFHPDWVITKAMELIDVTIGQETSSFSADASTRADQLMPLWEDRQSLRPEAWERRRTAQSRWLKAVAAPAVTQLEEVDSGALGQSDATYTRIFELLTCHRIVDAARLAEGANMFRLSLLLTQLGGDSSVPASMRCQLDLWTASGADYTIPHELLKVYRLIAGSVVVDGNGSEPESSLRGLGWERAAGVLFWYCSSSDSFCSGDVGTLSMALDSYRIVLQDSYADAPVSPYMHDRDPIGATVSYPSAQHGLYSLLSLLFPTSPPNAETEDMATDELEATSLLMKALAPSGYTRDELDYRASYLLLVLLECAGISAIDSAHGRIIRLHFIAQLLSESMWLWALFVALQISDVSIRYALTRDIMFRFSPIDATIPEDEIANYLKQLNVPVTLFYEAKAYHCGCQQGDHRQEVSYLIHAGQLRIATEKAVHCLVPAEILADEDATKKLRDLLELIVPAALDDDSMYSDYWSHLGHIFLTYLRLKHAVGGDQRREEDSNRWPNASDLYDEATELLNRLSSFIASSRASSSHQLGLNNKERQRMEVVLFDVSSYVHGLLQELELSGAKATSSSGSRAGRIAPSYVQQLPLFNERVVTAVQASNGRYLHEASIQLGSCFNDYFGGPFPVHAT